MKLSYLLPLLVLSAFTGKAQVITYVPLHENTSFNGRDVTTGPVGSIAGAANVSPTGAATYTLPIWCSPGTNGATPEVALVYNSQGGNGIAGMGWSISGLSAITRINKDIYHDGEVAPFDFSANDKFALDGTRLISNGSQYVLETEDFSQIIPNYTNNKLHWFSIRRKDGTELEYGKTSDSRFLSDNGTEIIMWYLNRVKDINGNYIEYEYDYDHYGRTCALKRIKYTGNDISGQLPFNTIEFSYATRSDADHQYQSGNRISSTLLLNAIYIKQQSSIEKTYEFAYGTDNINSFLKEITEKTANNAKLNSTIFKYGGINVNFEQLQETNLNLPYQNSPYTGDVDLLGGDFNGDGLTDVVAAAYTVHQYMHGGKIKKTKYYSDFTVYHKTNTAQDYSQVFSNQLNQQNELVRNDNQANYYSHDFNGDGKDDILLYKTSGTLPFSTYQGVDIYYSTTTSFNKVSYGVPSGGWDKIPYYSYDPGQPLNYFFIGDFNGDGKKDYLSLLCENLNFRSGRAYISEPGKNQINELVSFSADPFVDYHNADEWIYELAEADKAYVIDFDGDGKSEIMFTKGNYTAVVGFKENGVGGWNAQTALINYPTASDQVWLGDFNGDRKTDILTRNSSNTWELRHSTGSKWNVAATPNLSAYQEICVGQTNYVGDRIFVGDYNADGKSDILFYNHFCPTSGPHYSELTLYYSKGYSFSNGEIHNWNHILSPYVCMLSDGNGDGRAELLYREGTGNFNFLQVLAFRNSGKENLLEKVSDGFGNITRFDYQPLTSGVNYIKGNSSSYPLIDIKPSLHVVQHMFQPNGVGSETQTNYNYESAVAHLQGRGFLGFKKLIAHNLTTGIKSETISDFDQTYFAPYIKETNTYNTQTNQQITHTVNNIDFVQGTVASQGAMRGNFYQQLKTQTEQNLLTGATTTTTNTYNNNYGTISSSTTDINGVESITTATTYAQPGYTTIPCMPDVVTVTKTRTGEVTVSESTKYNYDGSGRVSTRYDRWGATGYVIQNDFSYDYYGNIAQTIVSGTASVTKTMEYEYDPLTNRFPIKVTNAGMSPSQISTSTWDPVWGKPLTQTDVDGIITTNTYDDWGKLTSTKIKTGLPQEETITYTDGWESGGNSYYTLTSHPTKPDVKTWYDKLGRVIKTKTEHLNNQWTESTRTYDSKGNVLSETAPKLPSESAFTTNYYYNDPYNRLTSTTNNFGTTNYSYSFPGNGQVKTTVTNPAGQDKTSTVDAAGKTTRETDNGGFLDYSYDSWGNVTEVNNTRTTVMTHSYNAYGIKTNTYDISAGITTYNYNAFGQLLSEKDANNCTHTFLYNALGQVTTRSGPEGTTTYTYNQAGGGATNQLASITGFGTNPVTEGFTYDGLGRLTQKDKYIDGSLYTTNYTYDANDNLIKKQYSDGFELNYNYTNGFLETVVDKYGHKFFKSPVYNGQGQVKQYQLGNGLTTTNTYYHGYLTRTATPGVQDLEMTYDYTTGNLTMRNEHIKLLRENFKYDDLNRLTESYVEGYGSNPFTTTPININYDVANQGESKGNIIEKSDAGTFGVNHFMQTTQTRNEGQLIGLNTQDITYTCFRKTATVTETLGHYPNGIQFPYTQTFSYDAGYDRVMTELTGTDTLTNDPIHLKRHYLDDYEVTQDFANGTITYVHYIAGADGLCAIAEGQSMGSPTYHYIYKDHLGSIVVATDANSTIEIEQNFDAWGRERDPQNWLHGHGSLPGVGLTNSWLYRGYTGHEHMPYFSMINMNGRMYDPIQGRMMSPDIYIHGGTQGYNRYSYCLNNPLSYVDPDGNEPITIGIYTAVAIGAAISAAAYTANIALSSGGFKNWNWSSFAYTTISGGIMGGMTYGIGSAFGAVATYGGWGEVGRAATHGLVGYMSTGTLNGAMVSAVSSGMGSATQGIDVFNTAVGGTLLSATIGGITAEMGGGEFWQGAVQAAAVHLLNQKMHNKKYHPAPKKVPGHPEAGKGTYNQKSGRMRWKMPNGDIWEWDKQHGEVEVYDKTGKQHKGSFNPRTGKVKDPIPGRTTPKFTFPPEILRLINNYYKNATIQPTPMPSPIPSVVPFNQKLMELITPPTFNNLHPEMQ